MQLSQGAYNTKENRPHFVMANEIRAEIFPGTDLCITYSCRKNSSEENSSKQTVGSCYLDQTYEVKWSAKHSDLLQDKKVYRSKRMWKRVTGSTNEIVSGDMYLQEER